MTVNRRIKVTITSSPHALAVLKKDKLSNYFSPGQSGSSNTISCACHMHPRRQPHGTLVSAVHKHRTIPQKDLQIGVLPQYEVATNTQLLLTLTVKCICKKHRCMRNKWGINLPPRWYKWQSAVACGACKSCQRPGFEYRVKGASWFKKSQSAVSTTERYFTLSVVCLIVECTKRQHKGNSKKHSDSCSPAWLKMDLKVCPATTTF